jgi:hypothetical protein
MIMAVLGSRIAAIVAVMLLWFLIVMIVPLILVIFGVILRADGNGDRRGE